MNIEDIIGSKEQQEEGVWVQFEKEVKFKLVHSNAREPQAFYNRGLMKIRRKTPRGMEPPPDKLEALTIEMLVEHVVKGWEGLTTKNAQGEQVPFPFTKENCTRLLTQSALIRDFVANEAMDVENFGAKLSGSSSEAEGTGDANFKSDAGASASVGA